MRHRAAEGRGEKKKCPRTCVRVELVCTCVRARGRHMLSGRNWHAFSFSFSKARPFLIIANVSRTVTQRRCSRRVRAAANPAFLSNVQSFRIVRHCRPLFRESISNCMSRTVSRLLKATKDGRSFFQQTNHCISLYFYVHRIKVNYLIRHYKLF